MTVFDDAQAVGNQLLDDLVAMTEERDALAAASTVLVTEIERLETELDACQNPPPPPPEITTTFGAYAQPQGPQAFDTFEANIGPIGVTRLFYGIGSSLQTNLPRPGCATIASLHSRTFGGARPSHDATAGGAVDAGVMTFAGKVKAYLEANPDELFIMSFVAEPDVAANADLGSPTSYRAAYVHVREVFDSVVTVPWALILTGSTFATNSPTRNPSLWWEPSEYVGIDPYNMGYKDTTWKASLEPETQAAADFAASKGVPLIVPEFGSVWHESDPNKRAGWITDQAEMFRRLGVEHACYFNANKTGESGNTNDHRNFQLTGAAEVAAYRAILTEEAP